MVFNLNKYFLHDNCKIYYSENIKNDTFLASLDNNSYIFFQFPWNIEPIIDNFPWDMEKNIKKLNANFNIKTNIIYGAPTEHTLTIIKNKGFRAILLNHNCFINYNIYKILDNENKIYDAVINSRPFWWKRVYLASKIKNLVYIKGVDWANDETSWLGYKSMNLTLKSKINKNEVNKTLNQSKIGLILSGNTGRNKQFLKEGANYSTTEYLLCGLPVVSTYNQGGRNYWLDSYNSIICNPSEDDIYDSVNDLLQKINNKNIDHVLIRNRCIDKMEHLRLNFINETQKIFNNHNINIDASIYFNNNFIDKMCKY
jgi:glycosyltransferase involved in cell wall biosynthesis